MNKFKCTTFRIVALLPGWQTKICGHIAHLNLACHSLSSLEIRLNVMRTGRDIGCASIRGAKWKVSLFQRFFLVFKLIMFDLTLIKPNSRQFGAQRFRRIEATYHQLSHARYDRTNQLRILRNVPKKQIKFAKQNRRSVNQVRFNQWISCIHEICSHFNFWFHFVLSACFSIFCILKTFN